MTARAKKSTTPNAQVISPEEKVEPLKMILKEIVVDKFTTIRFRVPLTGCVCEDCGFDFCQRNGFPEWDDLDVGQQAVVTEAIKQHKALHSVAEQRVVEADQVIQNNLGKPLSP